MKLVDHGVPPRNAWHLCRLRFVGDDNAFGRIRCAVAIIGNETGGVVDRVPEMARRELEAPVEGFCVRIDQQLVGIETMPVGRVIRPVDAIAITLPGAPAIDMYPPKLAVSLQVEACGLLRTLLIEKAKLNPFGMRGENREARAMLVDDGTHARIRRCHLGCSRSC